MDAIVLIPCWKTMMLTICCTFCRLSAERNLRKNDRIRLFQANIMWLTNVLKNTMVRYRISATQLKLHGIVCLDKGLLCLFPASLIPFSLAHSPELNDWGNCSRKPYNSTLFNLCNLGRIKFLALQLTVRSNVHYTDVKLSSYHIIISGEFSLPSLNSLILYDSPCHYHHSTH